MPRNDAPTPDPLLGTPPDPTVSDATVPPPDQTIEVPDSAGAEITVTPGGATPRVYPVTNGRATVSVAEVDLFLAVVDGAHRPA